MKECGKCKTEKSFSEFTKNKSKKDGLQIHCSICRNKVKKDWVLKNKEHVYNYRKEYGKNNPEKMKLYSKRQLNCEIAKQKKKEYRLNNIDKVKKQEKISKIKNKDKIRKTSEAYRIKNKEKINKKVNENRRNRKKVDPLFKLSSTIRVAINTSLKRNGYSKKARAFKILGCEFEDFKFYIESKFEPWMTWDNHGLYNGELNYGWDLDHIMPIVSAKTEDEMIKLNHYTNFQPLCGYINRNIKRDNY